jgi:hypothetical protein
MRNSAWGLVAQFAIIVMFVQALPANCKLNHCGAILWPRR